MQSESIHENLGRVRPDRIHIKYEVFTNGAVVEKELPFVVGVMGDFSGKPTAPLKPLVDRKFIQIDRDNINQVMARMTPGLEFRVENTLQNDGTEIPIKLAFNSMEDFEPARVVDQIEPLKKLLEYRNRLKDLANQVDRSPEVENLLEQMLRDAETMKVGKEKFGGE